MISFSQNNYYYYQGEKVFLTPTYQYVNIVTSNAFDEASITANEVVEFSMNTEKEMRNGEYKKHAQLEFTAIISIAESYC